MTERLLQYIWQFGHFSQTSLFTQEGETVQIISRGQINTNEGPDFLDARIRIGETVLAGSVELHIKTSDWHRHQHEGDKNYKNVILHVVHTHDTELNNGIPTLELQPHIANVLIDRYGGLMQNTGFVACESEIASVKELTWLAWKERLAAERLTEKAKAILDNLEANKNNWEESFWWLLARSFGAKVNASAFEAVARSIPVLIIAKHKNSIHQLEALLLGQANLLNGEFTDDYPQMLQREYKYLQHLHKLTPIKEGVYFLRMRPSNFPSLRLAQLAMLLHKASHLFSKILEAEELEEVQDLFKSMPNDFWYYHYRLEEASEYKPKPIGATMLDLILINTVIPTLFAYGLFHKKEPLKEKALRWLQEIKAESNTIVKGYDSLSIKATSAFDSQALLHLKKSYCTQKRCLDCAIGNTILKKQNTPTL